MHGILHTRRETLHHINFDNLNYTSDEYQTVIEKVSFLSLQDTLCQKTTNLHPPFPFLSLMSIKIKYGFSWEWRLIAVDLKRSHCCNNDEKRVEENEKIAAVTLQKERKRVKINTFAICMQMFSEPTSPQSKTKAFWKTKWSCQVP